ncbi:MAG TPA: molybdopterin-dependent oxidoreductase [Acetobacteraceae bacterium]|nr:molybdopterin-dependent oxidoreductase [Acetobacteraceae bacterium]
MTELIVHKSEPLNAETPLASLAEAFITPARLFYIRTHGDIPRLDAAQHRLRVEGLVSEPLDLSMEELRSRFPRRVVTATLQCAGNRRAELSEIAPVSGTQWGPGAIGTADWAGVALADVLRAAGIWDDTAAELHVAFEAADMVSKEGRQFTFGTSIPLAKALSSEVLLADEMNGAPLAPEHGLPLRAVVPGYIGARSPKWLTAIRVQDKPSANYFQQMDYKLYPSWMSPEGIDPQAGATLCEFPLNAVICSPADGAIVPAGPVMLRGYAVASGRPIERVEISTDSGRHWARAETEARHGERWTWVLWTARIDLPPGDYELIVRAWDGAAQTQPERAEHVWNPKGYVAGAWHRLRVRVGEGPLTP